MRFVRDFCTHEKERTGLPRVAVRLSYRAGCRAEAMSAFAQRSQPKGHTRVTPSRVSVTGRIVTLVRRFACPEPGDVMRWPTPDEGRTRARRLRSKERGRADSDAVLHKRRRVGHPTRQRASPEDNAISEPSVGNGKFENVAFSEFDPFSRALTAIVHGGSVKVLIVRFPWWVQPVIATHHSRGGKGCKR